MTKRLTEEIDGIGVFTYDADLLVAAHELKKPVLLELAKKRSYKGLYLLNKLELAIIYADTLTAQRDETRKQVDASSRAWDVPALLCPHGIDATRSCGICADDLANEKALADSGPLGRPRVGDVVVHKIGDERKRIVMHVHSTDPYVLLDDGNNVWVAMDHLIVVSRNAGQGGFFGSRDRGLERCAFGNVHAIETCPGCGTEDANGNQIAPRVEIHTGGELHPVPKMPTPDFVFNLSRLLDDPARKPDADLVRRDGTDLRMQDFVFDTEGAQELYNRIVVLIESQIDRGKDITVLVLCRGGKHRSVAFGENLAALFEVKATHHHIDLPIVVGGRDRGLAQSGFVRADETRTASQQMIKDLIEERTRLQDALDRLRVGVAWLTGRYEKAGVVPMAALDKTLKENR